MNTFFSDVQQTNIFMFIWRKPKEKKAEINFIKKHMKKNITQKRNFSAEMNFIIKQQKTNITRSPSSWIKPVSHPKEQIITNMNFITKQRQKQRKINITRISSSWKKPVSHPKEQIITNMNFITKQFKKAAVAPSLSNL
jgi:hypothetical protein